MKKLLLFAMILLFCNQGEAQPAAGRMLLTGQLSYNQTSTDNNNSPEHSNDYAITRNKSKNAGINLNVGYFISSHVALGILGSYRYGSATSDYSSKYISNQVTTEDDHSKQKNNQYAAGVFGRYYQMIGESRFAFFGQLSVAYTFGTAKDYETNEGTNYSALADTKTTSRGISIGLSPGLTYFISNKFALETQVGSFGFNRTDSKTFSAGERIATGDANLFTASLSLSSIYFGMSYYFGGK